MFPRLLLILLFFILNSLFFIHPVKAISDPLTVPNNKFGVHIITPSIDEASPAAELVNSSGGDWGYLTVLVESKNRDHGKWQQFFDMLRRKHLIPIVRLATQPEGDYWKKPYEGEEIAWADFLDNLNWPTKNRYVIVYNEPNQAQEWAGTADPKSYARVLDKTITALKNKSEDFFILNAGFDASAPHKPPKFFDEISYLQEMEEEVPGILNRLDGWVSHSYPNPGFVGSPDGVGRGTVRTWFWELQVLRGLGVTKILPVFITETGWKHAEGINFDKSLPEAEKVADYYKNAFQVAWESSRIVAITPFLLNYQEEPFDHFSFKRVTGEKQNLKILGLSTEDQPRYPQFYPQYQEIVSLPKKSGQPIQINEAELIEGLVYSSIVEEEEYKIPLKFKNIGQSIWGDGEKFELRAITGEKELGILPVRLPEGQKIEPGQEVTFVIQFKAPKSGKYEVTLQLFRGSKPLDSEPIKFTTEVKSPVILVIKSLLAWDQNPAGDYFLTTDSKIIRSTTLIRLDKNGQSDPLEARYLLPDYSFGFTLEKPFYKPKTINQKLSSGINVLDFGKLEPDFLALVLNPSKLWSMLTNR